MKRGVLWSIVVGVSVALWAVAALVLYVAQPILSGDPAGADAVRIDVPSGAALSAVAKLLLDSGAIRHPTIFERYAVLAGFDRQIRPGEYEFVPGESYQRILERLRRGDIVQIRVTIPEGFTNRDIANVLRQRMKIDADAFMVLTFDSDLRARYNIDSPSLEGYLYPDTYVLPSKSSARQVIEVLLQRFFTVWTPLHEQMAQARGMTRGQVLALASIIEGEALVDAETRRISAVYHNRLKRNMRLQADPTVLYALGGVRRRVLYKDLEVESPYNTYLNAGLPPGPICNPGLVAIEAALDPLSGSDDLYFVAARDGSGRHVFSRTLAEHVKQKSRAATRAADRSAANR